MTVSTVALDGSSIASGLANNSPGGDHPIQHANFTLSIIWHTYTCRRP